MAEQKRPQRYLVECVACRWTGMRKAAECECYDDFAMWCRPAAPGPGCPGSVIWPCPRCDEKLFRVFRKLHHA